MILEDWESPKIDWALLCAEYCASCFYACSAFYFSLWCRYWNVYCIYENLRLRAIRGLAQDHRVSQWKTPVPNSGFWYSVIITEASLVSLKKFSFPATSVLLFLFWPDIERSALFSLWPILPNLVSFAPPSLSARNQNGH